MGLISYFDDMSGVVVKQPPVIPPIEETFSGLPIIGDAVPVTLSEYDRVSKDVWTAHHAADYRKKTFSLVLLPKVDILFDRILEGSTFWNERLHTNGIDV